MRPRRGAVLAAVGAIALAGACGGDDASDDTLSDLGPAPGASVDGATAGSGDVPGSDETAVEPGAAGSGFVSIQLRLPASGIDETLSLDRATVPADALDPVSLDARCTPLDGGAEMVVAVTDLRRLAAGSQLVSVALRVDGGTAAGEHDAALDVSAADQVTTTFDGTAVLVEGGWSGTFEGADAGGGTASATFTCADVPVDTTTTVPAGAVEEVPDTVTATT